MVQPVERICTELEVAAAAFTEHEALEERHVPVEPARSAQRVVPEVAPGSLSRSREGTGAEPLSNGVRISNCRHQVGTVGAVRNHTANRGTAAARDVDRGARLCADDTGKRPATGDGSHRTTLGVTEQRNV